VANDPPTADQLRAIAEVKAEMETDRPMDRLICGDVGYGKTEVAMRAAFKAVMDAKQVVFLVPTTILAYQHYTNLLKRVEKFPIVVEMLSRFRTTSQQRKIVKRLKEGKIDIIVGTHRLLSGDIGFKELGLLIIDEEHRFGFYKRIADLCLFILGMFPEYVTMDYRRPSSGETRPKLFGRLRRSAEDYEEEGRRFYKLAGEHRDAAILDLTEVMSQLHEKFNLAKKPLNYISEHFLQFRRGKLFPSMYTN